MDAGSIPARSTKSVFVEAAAWKDTLSAVRKYGTLGRKAIWGWATGVLSRSRCREVVSYTGIAKAAKACIGSGVGNVDAQPTAGDWQCVAEPESSPASFYKDTFDGADMASTAHAKEWTQLAKGHTRVHR